MTATAPPQPARAPRRLRARAHALAAAAFVVLGALVMPGAAHAAATPAPSPSAAALSGDVTVTAAPLGNGVVRPDSALSVWVAADNGRPLPITAGAVTVSLGGGALPDRTALDAWLGGDTSGVAVQPIGNATLGAIASGARGTALVTVPSEDPVLAARAPGVYPILVTVSGAGTTHTATSVMIVPDDAAPKTPLALVVPVTAGPQSAGVISASSLAVLTGPDGLLTAQIEAVAGTTAALAIDPAVLASIRVLGTAAPPSATTWLARLAALPNARFALQYGDADVSAQIAAGRSTLLAPTSLTGYMNAADFAGLPAPTPTPTTTSAPTPTASGSPAPSPTATPPPAPVSPFPTLPELLDVGTQVTPAYWTPTGTATPAVVAGLAATGAEATRYRTLVDSASIAGRSTVPAHATAGGADLLVYDTAVSAALRDAASTDDTLLRGAALTAVEAGLAFAGAETGGAPLLVTVDRPAQPTAAGLRATVLAVAAGTRTTPAPLVAVLTSAAREVSVADAAAPAARTAAIPSFEAGEVKIGAFATILDDPSILTGRQRAEVLQLLGAAWIPDPDAWTAALAAHDSATTATLNAVSILPPSPLNLLSSDADLRFWIRNALPWPVTVVLSARPDNLRLEVESTTLVEDAQPLSNTRVQVPVQAKVGNGEVRIRLALHGADGVAIGSPESAPVNVRADWERIGLIALGVIVVGLLAIGVVRTIRRRRAVRAGEPTTDPSAG